MPMVTRLEGVGVSPLANGGEGIAFIDPQSGHVIEVPLDKGGKDAVRSILDGKFAAPRIALPGPLPGPLPGLPGFQNGSKP